MNCSPTAMIETVEEAASLSTLESKQVSNTECGRGIALPVDFAHGLVFQARLTIKQTKKHDV